MGIFVVFGWLVCGKLLAYKDFEIDRVFSFDGIYKKQSLRILSLQDRVSK